MFEYKTLASTSFSEIHDAFVDAFSDYEVQIDMPPEKLQDMLDARSFRSDLSLGCFDGKSLAGFSLTGYREIDGKKCCYDIAMGVRRSCRNKSAAGNLVSEMMIHLKRNGIDTFQLEVLENNLPARRIYERNGFRILRKLNCFETDKLHACGISSEYSFTEIPWAEFINLDEARFCSFEPSWQNNIKYSGNSAAGYRFLILKSQDATAGYAVFNEKSGAIMQLGISEKTRNTGLEAVLLDKIRILCGSERFSILNIEEGSYMSGILPETGFRISINQFEMIKEF